MIDLNQPVSNWIVIPVLALVIFGCVFILVSAFKTFKKGWINSGMGKPAIEGGWN